MSYLSDSNDEKEQEMQKKLKKRMVKMVVRLIFSILLFFAFVFIAREPIRMALSGGNLVVEHNRQPLFVNFFAFAKMGIMMVFAVVGLTLLVKLGKQRREAKKLYDERVVKRAIREAIPGAEFVRNDSMDMNALHQYGILPSYDVSRARGKVTFQRDGENYVVSNIQLIRKERDKNNEEENVTTYEGQCFTAKYKTALPGTVRIISTQMLFHAKEVNSEYPSKKKTENKIETENIQFNRQFDVYATDESSAFFLLNPLVMEQLLVMKDRYDGMAIYLSGDRIYITLKTNEILFLERVFQPSQEQACLEKVKKEAGEMLSLSKLLEDSLNGSIENNFTLKHSV